MLPIQACWEGDDARFEDLRRDFAKERNYDCLDKGASLVELPFFRAFC